jgi:hypothetical protein
METLSVVVAAVALAVSVVVFFDNRAREQRAARLARRPALVFTWDGLRRAWELSNIGSGPALDVVILQRARGAWDHPLRMPELGVGDTQVVPRRWYEHWHEDPGLGARYRSITGERYLTRTEDDWSQISEGWAELEEGLNAETEPHWRYRDSARRAPAE